MLEFKDVNRVTSTISWLDSNTVLKFNVQLFKTSKKYGRTSFHKEVRYFYNQANSQVLNINLDCDSYISLEQNKPASNGEKVYARIYPADVYMFRQLLSTLCKLASSLNSFFVYKDGGLMLSQHIRPITMMLKDQNYISFQPDVTVINGEERGMIRVNLSSETNIIYIDSEKIFELEEIFTNFNMKHYQMELLNYIGRPKFGTNMYQIGNANEGVISPVDRTIESLMPNQGFFSGRYMV